MGAVRSYIKLIVVTRFIACYIQSEEDNTLDSIENKAPESSVLRGIVAARLPKAVFCLLIFLSAFSYCISVRADETEKKLKGFSEKFIRQEKAIQALERAKVFLEEKSLDLARKELVSALKLDSELIEARYVLGLLEMEAGNYKLALDHLTEVYKKKPDQKGLHLQIVRSYLALGDCLQAKTWLERHLKTNPKSEQTDKLELEIKKCQAKEEKKVD